jgi:hypothetical protein
MTPRTDPDFAQITDDPLTGSPALERWRWGAPA